MTVEELREKLVEKSNECQSYIDKYTGGIDVQIWAKCSWEQYKLGVDYAIYLIDKRD